MTVQVPALPTEKTKSILVRVSVVAGVLIGLAVLLPMVWFAFLSSLGVIGILILGVLGFGIVKSFPLLAQKWENFLLKSRKAEARANPIEQMHQGLKFKATQLDNFKTGLTSIGAQIKGLETMTNDQAAKDPGYDLSDQRSAIQSMKNFYEQKKMVYNTAYDALQDYKKEIKRAEFKFSFGNAATGIAAAMNDNDARVLMNNMLCDEAFAAVNQRYDAAFSALDIESMELSNSKQIEFGKGITIDVQAIKIPTEQPVLAGVK